jgi:hypothetical protein
VVVAVADVVAPSRVAEEPSTVALPIAGPLEVEPSADSPSARRIAANLAIVQTAASHSLLGSATGFEARAMPVRTTIEPLQQITPPGETRRARLLTAMVSTASLETSLRSTERAANRLAEERLQEQMARFAARGAGVQMKF